MDISQLFIHSPVEGFKDQFEIITNEAIINIHRFLCGLRFSFHFGKYLRVAFMGHVVVSVYLQNSFQVGLSFAAQGRRMRAVVPCPCQSGCCQVFCCCCFVFKPISHCNRWVHFLFHFIE